MNTLDHEHNEFIKICSSIWLSSHQCVINSVCYEHTEFITHLQLDSRIAEQILKI